MRARHTPGNSQAAGFTLTELMIAMVVGLVVVGGVVTLFVQGRHSFRVDDQVARMQDEARFAVAELSRDLRMAAFLGEPLLPATITQDGALALDADCGPAGQPEWIFNLHDEATGAINTITAVDNATGPGAAAAYSCIDAGEIRAGTDVVAIKRVAGETVATADLVPGETYIRSNGIIGLLYTQPPASNIPTPFADRPYRPRIYYIRNFSDTPGDGLPSLCRKTLIVGSPPSMGTECIARGIENIQFEYGLDTNRDGTPERFVPDPALDDMDQVVAIRFMLLARTENRDTRHTDGRTYQLSNAAKYAPADNFHRRLYSVTVGVYNRKNIMRLGI